MNAGFEYQHYKGGFYEFMGVALPYSKASLETLGDDVADYNVYDADPIEEFSEIQVWEKAGIMLINHDFPCVVYRSYIDYDDERGREYGDTWARKVNDFFGQVPVVDGFEVKSVPRFSFHYEVERTSV